MTFTNDTPNWAPGDSVNKYNIKRIQPFRYPVSAIRVNYYNDDSESQTILEFYSTVQILEQNTSNNGLFIYVYTPKATPVDRQSTLGFLNVLNVATNPSIVGWEKNNTTFRLKELVIEYKYCTIFVAYSGSWQAPEVDTIDETLLITDKKIGVNLGANVPPYLVANPIDIVDGSLTVNPLSVRYIKTTTKNKAGEELYIKYTTLDFNTDTFFVNKNKQLDLKAYNVVVTYLDPNVGKPPGDDNE